MTNRGYLVSTLENNCFYVRAEICLHGKTINNRFKLVKNNRLLECTALKFTHRDISMTLNGYSLVHDIGVNYDRTSNILIGMDILKDFDFHCGESRVNGKYLFLGCLREEINSLYLDELYRHFGYISCD